MRFHVRHLPIGASAVAEETLEAASAEELRARLAAAGGTVLALRALREARVATRAERFDVAWWCR